MQRRTGWTGACVLLAMTALAGLAGAQTSAGRDTPGARATLTGRYSVTATGCLQKRGGASSSSTPSQEGTKGSGYELRNARLAGPLATPGMVGSNLSAATGGAPAGQPPPESDKSGESASDQPARTSEKTSHPVEKRKDPAEGPPASLPVEGLSASTFEQHLNEQVEIKGELTTASAQTRAQRGAPQIPSAGIGPLRATKIRTISKPCSGAAR